MKKPKTLETKLRSAIRLIWSRSKERREHIKGAMSAFETIYGTKGYFRCPICEKEWPIQMAEVDHIEPVGTLELDKLSEWVNKLFHSKQQVIDKLCHKQKTATQRRKKPK